MTPPRYGVKYPGYGNYTGGITESFRDAQAYARGYKDAVVYEVGTKDDPEVKRNEEVKE